MNESTELDATADPALKSQPAGIGGWLILPAFGLVLGAALGVVMLVYGLSLYSDVAAAGYGGVYGLELLVQFGMLVFMAYAAVRFFGKKRNAPSVIIIFLITTIVSAGVLLAVELGAGVEALAIESGKQLVRSGIAAAVWIPYFKKSRRVKATFIQ